MGGLREQKGNGVCQAPDGSSSGQAGSEVGFPLARSGMSDRTARQATPPAQTPRVLPACAARAGHGARRIPQIMN